MFKDPNIPDEYREHVFRQTGGFGKQVQEKKKVGQLQMSEQEKINLLETLIFK